MGNSFDAEDLVQAAFCIRVSMNTAYNFNRAIALNSLLYFRFAGAPKSYLMKKSMIQSFDIVPEVAPFTNDHVWPKAK